MQKKECTCAKLSFASGSFKILDNSNISKGYHQASKALCNASNGSCETKTSICNDLKLH